ncbi:hypothetical protein B0H14DRAFT_3426318 [Mycena olivaceomarginata]|nr:hypothetical protein B0H14DRAFT_3426318 [Mycena olivaceomarginata]
MFRPNQHTPDDAFGDAGGSRTLDTSIGEIFNLAGSAASEGGDDSEGENNASKPPYWWVEVHPLKVRYLPACNTSPTPGTTDTDAVLAPLGSRQGSVDMSVNDNEEMHPAPPAYNAVNAPPAAPVQQQLFAPPPPAVQPHPPAPQNPVPQQQPLAVQQAPLPQVQMPATPQLQHSTAHGAHQPLFGSPQVPFGAPPLVFGAAQQLQHVPVQHPPTPPATTRRRRATPSPPAAAILLANAGNHVLRKVEYATLLEQQIREVLHALIPDGTIIVNMLSLDKMLQNTGGTAKYKGTITVLAQVSDNTGAARAAALQTCGVHPSLTFWAHDLAANEAVRAWALAQWYVAGTGGDDDRGAPNAPPPSHTPKRQLLHVYTAIEIRGAPGVRHLQNNKPHIVPVLVHAPLPPRGGNRRTNSKTYPGTMPSLWEGEALALQEEAAAVTTAAAETVEAVEEAAGEVPDAEVETLPTIRWQILWSPTWGRAAGTKAAEATAAATVAIEADAVVAAAEAW